MSLNKSDIVLLGAGPAGMACAMELYNNGKQFVILEKDIAVGGLSKTLEFKEGDLVFRTDIGPHRFFSKNKYLYEFIEGILGKDWIVVNRQTRQFIEGKFYDYPIKAMQAFRNIGLLRAISMAFSYFIAIIKYRLFKKKIISFQDYLVANFGKKLADFNMLNYSEKIWGISCEEIHPDWGTQRIKGLSLKTALKDALSKNKKQSPKTLVDEFYYPKYGTGTIYETISKKIKEGNNEVNLGSYPTKIMHKNNIITELEVFKDGQTIKINPKQIVSSIPISMFVSLLSPKAPDDIIEASKNLKWRSQVYLFITLDKEKVTDDNWIYFPNKEIPFGRFSEMNNFSKEMSPPGKTSITVEFFVNFEDKIWNMNDEQIFRMAMRHFRKIKLFSDDDVRKYYVFKKKFVYPVYTIDYPQKVKKVKEYLDKFENLKYIGRPGRFFYTNQDHSLEMGILTAKSIANGTKIDLDKIGSENEYFENALLYSKENSKEA